MLAQTAGARRRDHKIPALGTIHFNFAQAHHAPNLRLMTEGGVCAQHLSAACLGASNAGKLALLRKVDETGALRKR